MLVSSFEFRVTRIPPSAIPNPNSFHLPGVPTSGKVFVYFFPSSVRSARPLQSQTRSRGKKRGEFTTFRTPFSVKKPGFFGEAGLLALDSRLWTLDSQKKMGPHRACWPRWSAYAITRGAWLDRSPRENPPPSVGDASADVDRISKSQARHFSPRPANGPIVVIGGENSTTILGRLG